MGVYYDPGSQNKSLGIIGHLPDRGRVLGPCQYRDHHSKIAEKYSLVNTAHCFRHTRAF